MSEKWKLSYFKLDISELTGLSSQSCIIFPSCMCLFINGIFYCLNWGGSFDSDFNYFSGGL